MLERTRISVPILVASVIAFVIVAGAGLVVYNRSRDATRAAEEPPFQNTEQLESIRPVGSTDHVLGNPQAPLVVVAYSDFGCPFCKEFHATMRKVMEVYGRDGSVAWVFRHIPNTRAHPRARTYALASECVASAAGEAGFWRFADELFETVTTEAQLEPEQILAIAERAGATPKDFTLCMRAERLADRIEADFAEALAAGATASPFVVFLTPNERLMREGTLTFTDVAGMVSIAQSAFGTPGVRKKEPSPAAMFNDTPQEEPTASTTVLTASSTPSGTASATIPSDVPVGTSTMP